MSRVRARVRFTDPFARGVRLDSIGGDRTPGRVRLLATELRVAPGVVSRV